MAFYRGEGGSGSGEVTTTPIPVVQGGTGATTAADARTNLGVTATGQDTNYAFRANNLSDLNSASTARDNLGLGSIATQDSDDVDITGGSVTGITDLAVADGGTGASTAANARINLLPSYTGNGSKVLSLNSGATDVEWTTNGAGTVSSVDMTVPTGLAVSGNPITSSGTLAVTYASGYAIPTTSKQSNWDTAYTDRLKWDGGSTGLDAATGRTSLGLGTAATTASTDYAVAAKGVTNGDSHDHSGGDGAQIAYSSLSGTPSLGTISSQNANNVSITGGSISGITDLAVADGGTGASTAADARVSLLPTYTGNGSKVLALNSGATDVEWVTNGNGTVTSVDISLPTGLSVSGNPITTSGTLAVTYSSGYAIPTTTKQTDWDTAYTDRLKWDGGSTGLDAATGRTSLGLGTAATTASTDYAPAAKGVTNGDSHDHNGGDGGQIAYSSLSGTPSLGTISSQDASNVSITGGSISGITDLAVADGGTGASTASNARINLLPSYTGNGSKVLALNSGATDVEWTSASTGTVTSVDITVPTGLAVSGNPITTSGTLAVTFASGYSIPTTTKQGEWDTAYTDRLKWDGGATGLDAATGRTSLGLGTAATTASTDYAPAAKGVTNGDSHDHNGGDGAQIAYSSLSGTPSLGTISSQNSNNVSITGGSVTGITDLAIADGGTGASTESGARTNLGATTVGSNVFTLTNPSAVTFIRINADNTVTARSAADFKSDLSLNNVENTALTTWAGSSNITTVGTVSTGTISGGTYS